MFAVSIMFPFLEESVEGLPRKVNFTNTEIEVRIEEFEGTLFIHGAQLTPLVANAHGT
jgi:hypothetical protein